MRHGLFALGLAVFAVAASAVPQINLTTFDGLAPTTTRGDLIYRNASTNTRLAAGTAGAPLITNGSSADPSYGVFRWSTIVASATTTMSGASHYYVGLFYGSAAATALQVAAVRPCAVASTIVRIDLRWFLLTAGSGETTSVLLVKNGSTASTLAASQTWNQTVLTAQNSAYTGLSVSCTAADDIELDVNGGATNFATDPVGIWGAAIHYTIP